MEIISKDVIHTERIGERLAAALPGGSIIRVLGQLGMGKTALARGIARGLGISERITSPSYPLIQEYPGSPGLTHVDLYRIHNADELDELGLIERIGDPDWIILIEWADRVPADTFGPAMEVQLLPGETMDQRSIRFSRTIDLEGAAHD